MPYQRAHFLLFLSKTARKTKERDGKCTRKGRTPSMEPRPRCVRQEPSLAWIHPSLGCLGNPSVATSWQVGVLSEIFCFPPLVINSISLTASEKNIIIITGRLSHRGMRFHSHRLCRIAVFQIRRAMQTIVSLMRTFMLARFARRDAVLLVRVHGAMRCVGLSNQLLKCSNSLKRHCPPSPFRASVTRSHTETNQERPWRRPGGGSFRTQNERGQGPPIVSPGR